MPKELKATHRRAYLRTYINSCRTTTNHTPNQAIPRSEGAAASPSIACNSHETVVILAKPELTTQQVLGQWVDENKSRQRNSEPEKATLVWTYKVERCVWGGDGE